MSTCSVISVYQRVGGASMVNVELRQTGEVAVYRPVGKRGMKEELVQGWKLQSEAGRGQKTRGGGGSGTFSEYCRQKTRGEKKREEKKP
jgi:hypothetical protein